MSGSRPLQPRPVLRALKDENKVSAIGGIISVDRRQMWFFVGLVFVGIMLNGSLDGVFAVNAKQKAAVFVPLSVAAAAFAFVKPHGRYLTFWGAKAVQNAMRPRRMRWIRRPAHRKKPLPESVQDQIPTDGLVWDLVRTVDGAYVKIFEVELLSLTLTSEARRAQVEKACCELYNRARFPFDEFTIARGRDVEGLVQRHRESVESHIGPHEHNLAEFARQRSRFLGQIGKLYGAQDRRAYVVLRFKPKDPVKGNSRALFASVKHGLALQREAREVHAQLRIRQNILSDGYRAMGASLRPLGGQEQLELLKREFGGGDRPERLVSVIPKAKSSSLVDVEFGPYESASPQRIKKVAKAQRKEVRGKLPPAVLLGDLRLSDRIAPDAVDIHDDAVRVGDEWHQTLFVYDYPDELEFNVLQNLANWQKPLKLSKHIVPVDRNAAIDLLGGKRAELKAAKKNNAGAGDVVEEVRTDLAEDRAQDALRRLVANKVNFFKVSFYVHLRAKSRRALAEDAREVEAELSSCGFTVKTARQEAWEGYITGQPLGMNWLVKRYAETGLLTDVVATLFSFGSRQINHKAGIPLGLDKDSGSLVVLDTYELANQHVLVLGITGSGKSVFLKRYTCDLRQRGDRVVVIDPVGDSGYGRVARALDGEYVGIRPGSDHRINPWDLRGGYLNLSYFSGSQYDRAKEGELLQKARRAALRGKKLMLTRLLGLMAGEGLTGEERSLVERLVGDVYAAKGITDDPATHEQEPPTFIDFFRLLRERASGNPVLARLLETLYSWDPSAGGSLSEYFAGQATVDLSRMYTVFRISDLGDREKPAIEFAILDYLVPVLSNPKERSALCFEELHDVLNNNEDDPISKFLSEFCRSGRARNNQLLAASQHPREFLDSKVGEVLMDQTDTKLFMKQKGRGAETLTQTFDLSEEEAYDLKHSARGEGILMVGEAQLNLRVLCSEEENELFNSAPELEKIYHKRRVEGARREAEAAAAGSPIASEAYRRHRAYVFGDIPAAYVPEDDAAPAEGDLAPPEAAPVPTAPAALAPPKVPVLALGSGRPVICAFYGHYAARAAYHAAGMAAAAGKAAGKRVLLADAEGRLLEMFPDGRAFSTADYICGGLKGPVRGAAVTDPTTGLDMLFAPEERGLPAEGLVARARAEYDAVFVACNTTAPAEVYARDWLTAADGVVATGEEARDLEKAVAESERLRGHNGTIVAPMGGLVLDGDLAAHAVFRLPPARAGEFEAAEREHTFATLGDGAVGAAFRPLIEEVLAGAAAGAGRTGEES